jgi:hypothetical protein
VLGALVVAYRAVAARGAKRVLRQLVVTGTGLLVPLVLFYAYVLLSIQLTPVPYYQDTKDGVSAELVEGFKDDTPPSFKRWLEPQGIDPGIGDRSERCGDEAELAPVCILEGDDLTLDGVGAFCIDVVRDCSQLDWCDSCDNAITTCKKAKVACGEAERCRVAHGCDTSEECNAWNHCETLDPCEMQDQCYAQDQCYVQDQCSACSKEQADCGLQRRFCPIFSQCCWHFKDERSGEWYDFSLWGHGETSLSDQSKRVSLSFHRLPLTSLGLVKLAKHIASRDESKSWSDTLDREDWVVSIALGLSLLALLVSLVTDANGLSLHGFYRDRLARAFVVRGRGKTSEGFDSASRLLLSDLEPQRSGAPYPLLNATLNVSGGIESSVRFRRGSSFVFSPQFVGSQATGYAATRAMEAADPELTLASAMAISAAAAGPNMGSFTSGALSPLFALFNLRLGYWLVHPKRVTSKWVLIKKPGNSHILREALGLIDHHGSFVNVSDGGHFENLGAYELIRRKCRLIVVVDSEEDGLGQLKGLMTLTRLARIDFGTVITADLSAFHPIEANKAAQPWLWAKIHYGVSPDGQDEVGYLLYIKANMATGVPHYVDAYRAQSPDFPHESTADQFFNEVQFECYRALGYHLGGLVTQNQQLRDQITDVLESAPAPSRAFGAPRA